MKMEIPLPEKMTTSLKSAYAYASISLIVRAAFVPDSDVSYRNTVWLCEDVTQNLL